MPSAQLKFKLPDGPATLSTERPDDDFRVLATRATATSLRVVLEVRTSDPTAIVRHLDDASWLPAYEILHTDERTMLIEYSLQSHPSLHRAILASGHLLQFPLDFQDGWLVSELITSHERLSRLKDAFESEGIAYQLDSVRQSTDPISLLTEQQHRFVTEAVERGYYDTPRECTLTELATELDVSKSGASGILHRAEGRIIKHFLGVSV
ncbi:helix-turn-helix domain-containing protein [Natrinema soli]|uniref:Helix-turn-helix domain-containing protein n=1 Tax=Natrinema soli TaxID=1930624 RepID=A0ABD5SHX4_9EURY|nr:helix-turn-helix domain-containing protein [Natrinema soli]